jgi:hypothetical protein
LELAGLKQKATGRPVGATRIDEYFLKRFLPSRLTPADYERLQNIDGRARPHRGGSHVVFTAGELMLLKRFEVIKHGFVGRPLSGNEPVRPQYLDLPLGIGSVDDPARGISQGRLCITW